MKGRFRKGKKAFRASIHIRTNRSPRQQRLTSRYLAWMTRKKMSRQSAIRMAQAALIAGSGAMALAMIRGQINKTAQEKAIAIAQQVIHTAQSISAIFNES